MRVWEIADQFGLENLRLEDRPQRRRDSEGRGLHPDDMPGPDLASQLSAVPDPAHFR